MVFAEQFYGAGRVFYSGASELWRLRAEDSEYFNAYWTKLLRRLAQGRLLAGDDGGRLVFERDRYALGDTLVVRAILPGREATDPLRLQVVPPEGDPLAVEMQASQRQPDTWVGRFLGDNAGRYEVATSGVGVDGASLTALAEVVAPAAERDQATRDAKLLTRIAQTGGGWYYPSAEAAVSGAGPAPPLADALPSREETRTVFGKVDLAYAERWSQGLLALVCGCLFLEWLTRRLASLA